MKYHDSRSSTLVISPPFKALRESNIDGSLTSGAPGSSGDSFLSAFEFSLLSALLFSAFAFSLLLLLSALLASFGLSALFSLRNP